MKKIIGILMLGAILFGGVHFVHAEEDVLNQQDVQVFFNEACNSCGELVQEFYPDFFAGYDLEMNQLDYINERENRKILTQYNEEWNIPFELQSHIEAFIGEKLVFGGHVPEEVMRYLLENPDRYERVLIFQDKMHGEETEYKAWDFNGDVQTYDINEPITTYLDWLAENGENNLNQKKAGFWGLFALITGSAFLDGLNPCAFAVLLFFIAFLFSIKRTKGSVWKMGLVYVSAIFLAYLSIGFGIAQAILISGSPHLMAYIGSYLVIGLGAIQLLGVAFPKFPIKLRIPVDTKTTLEKWMYKATLPASFVGGFLVGLCTFPCSGGIYVAIIGMLSAQGTFAQGFGWMIWYNLVFIFPLIILLIMAGNKKAVKKMQILERAESKKVKVLIGSFMIALGLIIIFFFT